MFLKSRDSSAAHYGRTYYRMDWQDAASWRIAWGGELIYLQALIAAVTEPRFSQSVPERRALEHTRKSIIARARASTRIVGFKYRIRMSAGGGSAPWPVHRGVLTRFHPQPQNPLVRVYFLGNFLSRPLRQVTCVHKLQNSWKTHEFHTIGLYPIKIITRYNPSRDANCCPI